MNKKLLVVGGAMLSICLTACEKPQTDSSDTSTSEETSSSVEETVYDLKNEDLPYLSHCFRPKPH